MKIIYKQFSRILKNSPIAQNLEPDQLKYFLELYQHAPAKTLILASKQILDLDKNYLDSLQIQNDLANQAATDLQQQISSANDFLKDSQIKEEEQDRQHQLKNINLTK